MDAAADNAQVTLPGAILAAERERQGLSPADIAQRLHMSVWQIEALESGNYARLPRGPFLRGFLRNYAKLLGVPSDDLVARLADVAPRDPAPRIVVPTQNIRFDPIGERMASPYLRAAALASVVIALGFAAMYWWVFVRPAPPVSARKAPDAATATAAPRAPVEKSNSVGTASAPESAPATVAIAPPPVASPPTVPAPAAPPKVATPAPEFRSPAAASAAVAETRSPAQPAATVPAAASPLATQTVAASEGGASLKLRFKGRSWVEIRDARGRVLLTGMNDPGSETAVSGKPPFKVVIGNAPEVKMFFNDREFDLEPHMREAVARLTVE